MLYGTWIPPDDGGEVYGGLGTHLRRLKKMPMEDVLRGILQSVLPFQRVKWDVSSFLV